MLETNHNGNGVKASVSRINRVAETQFSWAIPGKDSFRLHLEPHLAASTAKSSEEQTRFNIRQLLLSFGLDAYCASFSGSETLQRNDRASHLCACETMTGIIAARRHAHASQRSTIHSTRQMSKLPCIGAMMYHLRVNLTAKIHQLLSLSVVLVAYRCAAGGQFAMRALMLLYARQLLGAYGVCNSHAAAAVC